MPHMAVTTLKYFLVDNEDYIFVTEQAIGTNLMSHGQSQVPGADRFPIMVFSHGLGGMRTTYSYICADIASHGWVVAAVEHRDGSASMALTNNGPLLYERQAAGALIWFSWCSFLY